MLHPISWSIALPYYAMGFAIGYLLGSIPFGLILTRLAGGGDIRTIGSGNIGATNVLRTGRKGIAAATLLLDMLKGTAAVLLVYRWWGQDLAVCAAIGAVVGHIFPVWLKFKGGKGVATYLGVLLGMAWQGAVAFIVIWIVVAWLTRYSSLAALVATALVPIAFWFVGWRLETQLFGLLSVLLWITHRQNIVRLVKGTEGKIGGGSAAASSH
jgi:glycerol-3-phosphate acyltransferase PlsY